MPGNYEIPPAPSRPKVKKNQILLVASGDLRLSANQKCWPAQRRWRRRWRGAVADAGYELVRAHPYKADEQHGFIGSQKEGMAGLRRHRSRCAADRGRGRLAILASRAARA